MTGLHGNSGVVMHVYLGRASQNNNNADDETQNLGVLTYYLPGFLIE
jgi:hypothetical protein